MGHGMYRGAFLDKLHVADEIKARMDASRSLRLVTRRGRQRTLGTGTATSVAAATPSAAAAVAAVAADATAHGGGGAGADAGSGSGASVWAIPTAAGTSAPTPARAASGGASAVPAEETALAASAAEEAEEAEAGEGFAVAVADLMPSRSGPVEAPAAAASVADCSAEDAAAAATVLALAGCHAPPGFQANAHALRVRAAQLVIAAQPVQAAGHLSASSGATAAARVGWLAQTDSPGEVTVFVCGQAWPAAQAAAGAVADSAGSVTGSDTAAASAVAAAAEASDLLDTMLSIHGEAGGIPADELLQLLGVSLEAERRAVLTTSHDAASESRIGWPELQFAAHISDQMLLVAGRTAFAREREESSGHSDSKRAELHTLAEDMVPFLAKTHYPQWRQIPLPSSSEPQFESIETVMARCRGDDAGRLARAGVLLYDAERNFAVALIGRLALLCTSGLAGRYRPLYEGSFVTA